MKMTREPVYPCNSEIDWTAEWIGLLPAEAEHEPNRWIAFRRNLDLAVVPKEAPWIWL